MFLKCKAKVIVYSMLTLHTFYEYFGEWETALR